MKKFILSVVVSAAILAGMQTSSASEVTGLTSFTANTPAVAAQVNGNFTAVKSAVDNNHARLTTAEMGKQNRVVGTCAAGSSIRTINTDGSVVCQMDVIGGDITEVVAGPGLAGGATTGSVSLRLAGGAVSIPAAALSPNDSNSCQFQKGHSYYFYTSSTTSTSCNSYAPVQLPHGAALTGLTCRLYDNDPAGSNSVGLYRVQSSNNIWLAVYVTPPTIDSTGIQTLTDTTAGASNVVDNANYNYVLYWYTLPHNTITVGINAQFFNCTISYTY